MDIVTIIGVAGGAIILIAFFLNQTDRWQNSDIRFDAANVVGSGLLMLYAFLIGSVPFLFLNTVWTLVSLKDVVKYFRKQPRK